MSIDLLDRIRKDEDEITTLEAEINALRAKRHEIQERISEARDSIDLQSLAEKIRNRSGRDVRIQVLKPGTTEVVHEIQPPGAS